MKKDRVLSNEKENSTCANALLCAGTKLEAIKKAYGKHWENLKECIDENGWLLYRKSRPITLVSYFDVNDIEFDGFCSRPKSLNGIEKNNGWIKIEDKDNVTGINSIDIVYTDKGNIYSYATFCNFSSIHDLEKITHFQQLPKPNPPIY